MKKFICIMIALLISMNITLGYSSYWRKELQNTAIELKGDSTIETIRNIEYWAATEIEYKFYWDPRGLYRTWATKEGDCTDNSMLIQEMLRHNGIRTKLVHGYCINIDRKKYKHDWLVFNRKMIIDSTDRCGEYKEVGHGVW